MSKFIKFPVAVKYSNRRNDEQRIYPFCEQNFSPAQRPPQPLFQAIIAGKGCMMVSEDFCNKPKRSVVWPCSSPYRECREMMTPEDPLALTVLFLE